MTERVDRPNTAVLVIDVQNDVVAAAHERDAVVANIDQVVQQGRQAGLPVIWVQHNDDGLARDTPGWEIVPELEPLPEESIVHKSLRDSFEGTDLESILAANGIGRLIVTGAQTDFCVRWTLHGALTRGYDTVLVGDAHTTDAVSPGDMPDGQAIIAHTNSTWGSQAGGRCESSVTTASGLDL